MLLACVACDTNLPVAEAGAEWIVGSQPQDGDWAVARVGRFELMLGRSLVPSSVSRRTVRMSSGAVTELTFVSLDPVAMSIHVDVPASEPLEPGTTYQLELERLVDLDGNRLMQPVTLLFHTGQDLGEPAPVADVGWDEVSPLLGERCADGGCHAPPEPALGLDLSSPAGVQDTAIGVLARQSPRGTVSAEGASGSLSLSALPIIDVKAGVGQPGSSYLLYKILGDPHVLGDAMPPGGPGLTGDEASLISEWIRAGAPVR